MNMDDANPNIHKPYPTKPSPANTRNKDNNHIDNTSVRLRE